jgi:hypothetical protein
MKSEALRSTGQVFSLRGYVILFCSVLKVRGGERKRVEAAAANELCSEREFHFYPLSIRFLIAVISQQLPRAPKRTVANQS